MRCSMWLLLGWNENPHPEQIQKLTQFIQLMKNLKWTSYKQYTASQCIVKFIVLCVSDFAGILIPHGLSGHSLVPLTSQRNKQSTEPHPGWILSEYHGCNANASTYMLRMDKWKYITYSDGSSVPPQLFGELFGHGIKLNLTVTKQQLIQAFIVTNSEYQLVTIHWDQHYHPS